MIIVNNKVDLTYSEVIYLFAEKAVPERSWLINLESHPTGQKISVKPLSHKMVIAALVYLVDRGYVELSIKEVKKMIFFKGKEVFGKRIKNAGVDITGIEKILLENFKNETEVHKAVYYLLNDDESSPWGQIVALSKVSLAEKGFMLVEKVKKLIFVTDKYQIVESKKNESLSFYEEAKQKLREFTSKNKDLYKMIEKNVVQSIAARMEQSSSDD